MVVEDWCWRLSYLLHCTLANRILNDVLWSRFPFMLRIVLPRVIDGEVNSSMRLWRYVDISTNSTLQYSTHVQQPLITCHAPFKSWSVRFSRLPLPLGYQEGTMRAMKSSIYNQSRVFVHIVISASVPYTWNNPQETITNVNLWNQSGAIRYWHTYQGWE